MSAQDLLNQFLTQGIGWTVAPVPELIVGAPPASGGAGVYIGPQLPAPLATTYGALISVSRFNIEMSPDGIGYWYEIVGIFSGPRYFYAQGFVNSAGTVTESMQATTPVPNSVSASTVTWGGNDPATQPVVWRWTGPTTPQNQMLWENVRLIIGNNTPDGGSVDLRVQLNVNSTGSLIGDITYNGVSGPRGCIYFEAIMVSVPSGAVAGTEYLMRTTASAITFPTDRAYRVTFKGIKSSAAIQNPLVEIRENNLAGQVLIDGGREPIGVAGNNLAFMRQGIIVNDSGAPITAKLALTCTPSVATLVNILGGADASFAYWEVEDVGDLTFYQGVSLL